MFTNFSKGSDLPPLTFDNVLSQDLVEIFSQSPPWASSSSLDSDTSSDDFVPFLDYHAPFRSQKNESLRPDVDRLLATCSGKEFQRLWLIRLSQHEQWSKLSFAKHVSQLRMGDIGSPSWPVIHRVPKPPVHGPRLGAQTFVDPRKPWLDAFIAGCSTLEQQRLPALAAELLSRGCWDTEESFLLLVHEFRAACCDQSSRHSSPPVMVTRFMVAVHTCFREKHGVLKARQFLNLVETSTMESFRATWTQTPRTKGLRSNKGPANIQEAFALSSYLGALLSSGLLFHGAVQLAISFLLAKLVVVEQLEALHILFISAGDKLWETEASRAALKRWLGKIEYSVIQSKVNSSAIGMSNEADEWVLRLTNISCAQEKRVAEKLLVNKLREEAMQEHNQQEEMLREEQRQIRERHEKRLREEALEVVKQQLDHKRYVEKLQHAHDVVKARRLEEKLLEVIRRVEKSQPAQLLRKETCIQEFSLTEQPRLELPASEVKLPTPQSQKCFETKLRRGHKQYAEEFHLGLLSSILLFLIYNWVGN